MANFFDKLNDATLNTPKSVFERECKEYECYSLDNLEDSITLVGKVIDEENNTMQFSGILKVITKDLKGRQFLVSEEDHQVIELLPETYEIKIEEIQQKTKTATYETTVCKFIKRTLTLV